MANSFYAASNNPRQVIIFLWYITILAAGLFTAKEVALFCRVVIESTLGKPKLIRETSRKNLPCQYMLDFIEWVHRLWVGVEEIKVTKKHLDDNFSDVTLSKSLKGRILSLATAASKARENDTPHRHLLFYGPPGMSILFRNSVRLFGDTVTYGGYNHVINTSRYREDHGSTETGQIYWNGIRNNERR